MKKLFLLILALSLLLSACAQEEASRPEENTLRVTGGGAVDVLYTAEDLQTLGEAQATLDGVTYLGVPLHVLLAAAGFDLENISAVEAVAADGFTVNYGSDLFMREDVLVAYARADGPLAADEGTFRMVVPNEPGRMNPRDLVELEAIP